MERLSATDGVYLTPEPSPSWLARLLPSPAFYIPFMRIIYRGGCLGKRNQYFDDTWAGQSMAILRAAETVGIRFRIEGLDTLERVEGPCVLVGNHMSMLETMLLPGLIEPYMHHTYVVKQSLVEYPVFKWVMRSRDPVTVTRTDPRADMKAVMGGGAERLANGTSIVVFPQTTRTPAFDPEQFNSIGVKLARKAGVPVVPIALKTDAWANGKWLKDFGKIDPSRLVHFSFGEPIHITDRGAEAQQTVVAFIQDKLATWGHEQIVTADEAASEENGHRE